MKHTIEHRGFTFVQENEYHDTPFANCAVFYKDKLICPLKVYGVNCDIRNCEKAVYKAFEQEIEDTKNAIQYAKDFKEDHHREDEIIAAYEQAKKAMVYAEVMFLQTTPTKELTTTQKGKFKI